MARHCMPQNATHQIARIALRSAAPVNGGLGPERVRRVPSAAMAASSASTSSTKASMSLKASHEAGEVLAVLTAVPICCWSDGCCDGRRHNPSPSHASAPIHLKVASRPAPAGTPHLRTDSNSHETYGDGVVIVVRGRESRQHDEGPQVSDNRSIEVAAMAIAENTRVIYSDLLEEWHWKAGRHRKS